MGAVVVAQQHSALFQVEGGAALHKQAGGAVAPGRHIHRAALGAGGKGSLQLAGVVGGAIGHQAVAGCVHKEGLSLSGEIEGQSLALGFHCNGVGGAGQQAEQGEHIGLAGSVNGLAVQLNGEGMRRTIAQAVFQLEHGAAGHGTDQGKLHKQDASLDVERFMGCPQVAGMVH